MNLLQSLIFHFLISAQPYDTVCFIFLSKHSLLSSLFPIVSGPCIPGAVTALPRCLPDSVEVFWRASDGAQLYTATAETADGVRQSCSSAQSSCLISDLQCGELYFVQVIASDDQCNSTESFYITHQTGNFIYLTLTASFHL